MFVLQVIGVVCVAALCWAEPPANQYLPPNKGYDYPRPQVPFPSGPNGYPSQPPSYNRPPPSPPAPVPTYGTPSRPPTGPPAPYPPNLSGSPSGPNPITGFGPNDHLNQPHVPGMPFDFNYAVKDDYYGTDYSHNAVSDGDVVKGEYRVQLPDGRLQIVKYTADWATGFHADVSYEGQAQYPQGSPSGPYPAAVKPNQAYGPPSGPY